MSEHTPEPWETYGNCLSDGSKHIAYFETKEDAERALAAVNACAGIPTEQLGGVKALAEAAGAALQYIYLAYVQEGQAKRDELAGIAKRDFDALDAALAPFRKDEPC